MSVDTGSPLESVTATLRICMNIANGLAENAVGLAIFLNFEMISTYNFTCSLRVLFYKH